MLEKLADLDAEHAKAVAGGGEKYVDRHHDRGKLMPRERIELLDRRGLGVPRAVAAGRLGLGLHRRRQRGHRHRRDRGRRVHDHRQRPVGEGRRQQPVDGQEDLPGLADRRGERAARRSRWSSPAARTCRPRRRSSSRAASCSATSPARRRAKQPTVALVFGNSTAGGAYVPGMSDYTVMVKEQAKVFLGGPPLVKMATGEESDDESLGGAEMHARIVGPGRLPRRGRARRDPDRPADRRPAQLAQGASPPPTAWAEPDADPDGLLDLIPTDLKEPFDPREVIARICDGVSPTQRRRPSTSSSRSTARRWSPAGRSCTAGRSASSPTRRACCSARRRRRRRSSSSSPTRSTPRCCSCTTPPATWSARSTSRAASSSTAR